MSGNRFPVKKAEAGQIYKAIIVRGDDVRLTPDQAETVSNFMLAHKPGQVVRIEEQDITLRIGDVRRVERDFAAEAAQHTEKVKQTQLSLLKKREEARRTGCRGQYSIQRAINEIAFNEHPKNWGQFIKNTAWREEIRQVLLKAEGSWCDNKAGTCACDDRPSSLGGQRPYPNAFMQTMGAK